MSDSQNIGAVQATDGPATKPSAGRLSLGALIALGVGSMIGGGIFGLPQQMASAAAPGPLIIGWIITGFGMLMLAMVYQRLASSRPDINTGVYGYARAGFGNFIGFSSAWGYWLSAWLGNVGYLVLLMTALTVFFPGIGGGTTWTATIIASLLLWGYHLLILRGLETASFVNTIITICKVVPLLVFIIVAAFSFDAGVFSADFWGEASELGSTTAQIKNMMLVTVWVFIGVEGASVFSERAAKRSDVGKATITSFVSVLALLLLINILSYGVVARGDLANYEDPSLAGVLEHAVGPWGAKFIAGGLALSLVGGLLSWFLMCAEVISAPAEHGLMPTGLSALNKNGVPFRSVWLTTICVQVFIIIAHFSESTYTSLILLASSLILIPYLLSALFQLKESIAKKEQLRGKDLAVGILGSIYAVWLIYAAGLNYLLFTALFYLLGVPLYVWGRKERGERSFTTGEWVLLALFVLGAVFAIIGLVNGSLTI